MDLFNKKKVKELEKEIEQLRNCNKRQMEDITGLLGVKNQYQRKLIKIKDMVELV